MGGLLVVKSTIFYKYLAEYHAHKILRMSVDECG